MDRAENPIEKTGKPIPPSLIAEIALKAQAGEDSATLARMYGVSLHDIDQWQRKLITKAEALFTNSPEATTPDPSLQELDILSMSSAIDDLEICVAILRGEELRYTYANKAYRALVSPMAPQCMGHRLVDLFPNAKSDGVLAGLMKVLRTGETWHVKDFAAAVPGAPDAVWEGDVVCLGTSSEHGCDSLLLWLRNVSGPAKTEAALREDIALLQAISDTSTDVIFAKDLTGRITFANPATVALIGKPLDKILGHTDAEYLDDKAAAEIIMGNDRRIMQTCVAEEVEEIVAPPDGKKRVWLGKKRPLLDDKGIVVGLLGIARDITERKEAERQVTASHAALQRVLDSISDGLAILDHEWRYTYFSETGARMIGMQPEQLLGHCVWELFPEAETLLFGKEYRLAMQTGQARHFEEYYPAPLDKWLDCHCYPSSEGLSVYFRDVTDRKLAQDAAADSQRRLNAMLEASPVGLAFADAGGHLTMMNAECLRMWGNPPSAESVDEYQEWKGWWYDGSQRHGHQLEAHDWPMARALAGEHVVDAVVEIEPFNAPGQRNILLLRSIPIKNERGMITGAVTAQMDITEALQAKEALRESHRQLHQLANSIPQLAWMADASGHIHWYNDRWYEYTGTAVDGVSGWSWEDCHHPETLPAVLEKWRNSIATGVRFEMTFPLKGTDGVFRPFYTLVEPLRDSQGRVIQWFGTNTDVSTLQTVQAQLQQTQHWLKESLKAGRMVAWEWDLRSDEMKHSDNLMEIVGYDAPHPEAGWNHCHPDDAPRLRESIHRAIASRGSFDELTRRIRPDTGREVWVQSRGHVLEDNVGNPIMLRGILIDMTEQIIRQRALEESSRRKDEFLAMLAHELRNPLAPITYAAQVLGMTALDPAKVPQLAATIARQASHMSSLVDDLLDVSRVTRGLVELNYRPVCVNQCVNDAVEQARPLVDARGHRLNLQGLDTIVWIQGDPVRLCQILTNLINNAAKYTPDGGTIVLDMRVDGGSVTLSVIDNGIGISPTLLPHVFELFTQATRTPDRDQGGLGLGLALVEGLVKLQNGRVAAFSEGLGRGSRFSVTLPTITTPKQIVLMKDTLIVDEKPHLRILLVEDNKDSADTLAVMLENDGNDVTVVNLPSEALAAVEHRDFDVMLLDIGLPEMDGYELARRLRLSFQGLLVAVTGYGQENDKELAYAAGFNHHVVKPVTLSHLHVIFASYTRGK